VYIYDLFGNLIGEAILAAGVKPTSAPKPAEETFLFFLLVLLDQLHLR
jgi:hypothetical protein